MKANIPQELEHLIDEKIYLDLEVHILTKKLNETAAIKDDAAASYFEKRLDTKLKELRMVNDQLRKERVKIYDPHGDDLFVQYDFTVKMDAGFKEGSFRYWKAAIRSKLNKRMNKK